MFSIFIYLKRTPRVAGCSLISLCYIKHLEQIRYNKCDLNINQICSMNNFNQINNDLQAKKIIKKQLGRIYCPRCERKHYIKLLKDKRYYCSKCRYKFSLQVLLGFKHSKLSYLQVLRLIDCFTKNTPLKLACDLSLISYPSLRSNYTRLRLLLPKTKDKLVGDIIVDEAFVGKRKNNNQAIVMGAVNREFNKIHLEIVPDREQDSLEAFLLKYVDINSFITTDAWSSYYDITYYGYGHRIENHSRFQLKYSCPIERVWALFKTFLKRTYHHIWKEKLFEYLVEFQAKFNHREIVRNPLNLLTYLLKPCSKCLT